MCVWGGALVVRTWGARSRGRPRARESQSSLASVAMEAIVESSDFKRDDVARAGIGQGREGNEGGPHRDLVGVDGVAGDR